MESPRSSEIAKPTGMVEFFATHPIVRRGVALLTATALMYPVDVNNVSEPPVPAPCEAIPSKKSAKAVDRYISEAQRQGSGPESYSHYYYHTLPQAEKKVDSLLELPSSNPKQLRRYLLKADRLLEPYGLKFDTGNYQRFESKQQTAIQTAMAKETGRRAVANVVMGISLLPKEYVAASGLKKIRLTPKNSNVSGKFQAYVNPEDEKTKDTMYYSVKSEGDYTYPAHEIAHLIDAKECSPGGIEQDTQFTAHNPNDIYDNPRPKIKYSSVSNQKKLRRMAKKLNFYFANNIKDKYCTLDAKRAKILRRLSVISDYSLKDSNEDKAEMGGGLSVPSYYDTLLDKDTPRIRAKAKLMLRRLYDLSPVSAHKFVKRAYFDNSPYGKPPFECTDKQTGSR